MRSLIACWILVGFSQAFGQSDSWKPVVDKLGHSGKELPGEVYKVGLPRGDMHVTVDGVGLRPALALGSWVAFKIWATRRW